MPMDERERQGDRDIKIESRPEKWRGAARPEMKR